MSDTTDMHDFEMFDNNIYKYDDVLSRKDFDDFRHVIDNTFEVAGDKEQFDEKRISQYPIYKICKDASQLFGGKSFYATGTYRQEPNGESVDWHNDGNFVTCIYFLYAPKEGGELEFENSMIFIPKENRLIVFDGRITHRVRDTNELRQTFMMMFYRDDSVKEWKPYYRPSPQL